MAQIEDPMRGNVLKIQASEKDTVVRYIPFLNINASRDYNLKKKVYLSI